MFTLLQYLSGYITVAISGNNCEQILNLCAKHGVRYRRLHYKNGMIIGDIKIRDFRKLRKIRPKKCAKVHIIKRRGLPFKTVKYKNRIGFMAGFLIFIIILEFLSGIVWNIDVVGNKKVTDEEILSICQKHNIKRGTSVKEIDTLKTAQKLLIDHKKLAWASLNIEGTLLTVNVTESKNDNNDVAPSNLIANSDGEIRKIDVTSGTVCVKIGDTVRKGDILVSGIVENMSSTAFVNSKGTVTAYSIRDISITENYKQKLNIKTNEIKKRTVLEVLTLKIPFYFGQNRDSSIDEYSYKNIKLFGENLPIILHQKTSQITREVNKEYAKDELLKIIDKKLEKEIDGFNLKIIDKKEKELIFTDSNITVKQRIIVEENIAENQPLLISGIN